MGAMGASANCAFNDDMDIKADVSGCIHLRLMSTTTPTISKLLIGLFKGRICIITSRLWTSLDFSIDFIECSTYGFKQSNQLHTLNYYTSLKVNTASGLASSTNFMRITVLRKRSLLMLCSHIATTRWITGPGAFQEWNISKLIAMDLPQCPVNDSLGRQASYSVHEFQEDEFSLDSNQLSHWWSLHRVRRWLYVFVAATLSTHASNPIHYFNILKYVSKCWNMWNLCNA